MAELAGEHVLGGIHVLDGVHVLDGGLGSELEYRGADVSGPLWSAEVLEQQPEVVAGVHRSYVEAGAECIAAASYQISRRGYAELGRPAVEADQALRRAVDVACGVRDEFPSRRVVVAASLVPFGSVLHNGAEYHGNYEIPFADLVEFHRERVAVMAGTAADMVAFETVPSLEEARAIGEAIRGFPELRIWVSFVCRDGLHVAHGELLRECAALVAGWPQTVAVGVNCTAPEYVEQAIGELKAAGVARVMVYPNLGEGWDAVRRCWTSGTGGGAANNAAAYGSLAQVWFAAGAQIVGGCCRTRPEHIARVAAVAGGNR